MKKAVVWYLASLSKEDFVSLLGKALEVRKDMDHYEWWSEELNEQMYLDHLEEEKLRQGIVDAVREEEDCSHRKVFLDYLGETVICPDCGETIQ